MSGLETVKIIVDAEKEASKLLNEAQAKALEIRKQVDVAIAAERERRLSKARKDAESILQQAEIEGKAEAARLKTGSEEKIRKDIQKASSAHDAAVKALLGIVMG